MWRPCGVFDDTYSSDMSIVRTKFQRFCLIGSLVLLAIFPLFKTYYLLSLVNKMAIIAIVAMGLQIVSGLCGQISFGQAAFMAVGAYTTCILTNGGWSFWIAMPIAGLVAGLLGLFGGASALRVKEFYLAIATLAMHFVIIWLTMHMDITGGTDGLHMDYPSFFGILIEEESQKFYVIIPVLVLMTFAARNLQRTRIGRVFVAIRDNDLAAEVMGINLFYYKLLAFFIACFYAGVAGSLWVLWIGLAHPDQFALLENVYYLGMIIIGGMGSIPGVFFGVVFIMVIDEILLFAAPSISAFFPWLGMDVAANLGFSVFGIMIVLFLIFEPRGLYHRWNIVKSSLRLYPFTY